MVCPATQNFFPLNNTITEGTKNKNPRRRAAGYFCSPGELHFGFNTPRYAAERRGIKPYGSNNEQINDTKTPLALTIDSTLIMEFDSPPLGDALALFMGL
ncbi:MAG: hypothetical protein Ta2B_03020 [Termitinemataceae bacterium]|nr:MAG: hypothetical protein Ta2B_03020 [Termitinemataceae bacterium]